VTPLSRLVTLTAIRSVHTVVFAVELASIGWLVGTGATGRRDRTVGLAAELVAAESLVWVANDHVCPLTPLAERFGAERGSVSDIFLPDALARTLPIWSSALLVLGLVLHVRSAWSRRAARMSPGSRPRCTRAMLRSRSCWSGWAHLRGCGMPARE
jgi:hypothetical protein